MKLYYLPGACPLASQIALEWSGLPYEAQKVSREEIKQPDYLAMNPQGVVPTLVDGDFVLTQSVAVLEYIAERAPQAELIPDDIQARADVRRWLAFCNADIHKTFALIFGAMRYSDSPEAQQELASKASAMLTDLFAIADRQLQDKDWIAGRRSVADPYLYTVLRWAHAKNVDLSGLDRLKRFYDRMDADAGVQAALKKQGLA